MLAAIIFLIPLASPCLARSIVGRPRIVDGDTIRIARQRIRLFGIDAPESKQTCTRGGRAYACGKDATLALAHLIGKNRVYCHPRDRDRYGRIVAVCDAGGPDGPDINAGMVGEGWALAYRHYSMKYVPLENEARKARRGLWAGTFVKPWVWRHRRSQDF